MMFQTTALHNFMPFEWTTENYRNVGHTLVQIEKSSPDYWSYSSQITGNFNGGITKIDRVQNPFLYGQFLLKQEEYRSRNINFYIKELFHDTAEKNVNSIVTNNFDWRLTKRAKFGRGVSFSPSPTYANKQSSHKNGSKRAMIVANVLVGNEEIGRERQTLPQSGDTTTGNKRKVYVKYFDYEFYPTYVVYYKNVSQVQKCNRHSPTNDDHASTSATSYEFDDYFDDYYD